MREKNAQLHNWKVCPCSHMEAEHPYGLSQFLSIGFCNLSKGIFWIRTSLSPSSPTFLMQFYEYYIKRKNKTHDYIQDLLKLTVNSSLGSSVMRTRTADRLPQPWAISWKVSRPLLILGALAFSLSPTCQTSFLEPEAPSRVHFISLHTWCFLRPSSTANNHSAYKASSNVFQQDVLPS